jgi:micrococcal nuclease
MASKMINCKGVKMLRQLGLGLLLSVSMSAWAYTASGVVTGVHDGDTIYVKADDGSSLRVRLAEIDAPEIGQAFGRRSEQSLREMVAKKRVQLTWGETDRYGRIVAHVVVDGLDANTEQVRRGWAWVYRQYAKDKRLVGLEEAAKGAGLGLWSDPHPVNPADWRRSNR